MSARESLHHVERDVGALSSLMSAEQLLKPAGIALLEEPVVYYLAKMDGARIVDRAWAVIPRGTPVDPREQDVFAARVGKKLFSALIAKSKVHYSVPHLHDHRLYVLLPHHAHAVIPTARGPAGAAGGSIRMTDEQIEHVRSRVASVAAQNASDTLIEQGKRGEVKALYGGNYDNHPDWSGYFMSSMESLLDELISSRAHPSTLRDYGLERPLTGEEYKRIFGANESMYGLSPAPESVPVRKRRQRRARTVRS